jgi:hypothetical protein
MASLFGRITRLARSPQGKRAIGQARRLASDPRNRRRMSDAGRRLRRRK